MTIVERVHALQLPMDEIVVIGSGILDVLQLRPSRDIDLVVTPRLFFELQMSVDWKAAMSHGEMVLTKDDAEVWQSWGNGGRPNFDALYDEGVLIDGVMFANPQYVIDWKSKKGRDKDLADISLLKGYLTR